MKLSEIIKTEYLTPENDGVTHINIYSKGKTELGKLLSNWARVPMVTPFGNFESLEGYWYWLRSDTICDRLPLHELYGWNAKEYGSKLPQNNRYDLDKFQQYIRDAQKIKIEADLRLKELFINSTLPFEHYYTFSKEGEKTKVVTIDRHRWQVENLELLRKEYKNG